jgi:hypothetical protein
VVITGATSGIGEVAARGGLRQAYAPGTKMTFVGESDPAKGADIIDYRLVGQSRAVPSKLSLWGRILAAPGSPAEPFRA